MKKYYHATDIKNFDSILAEGIRPGCDGIVYLTERPEEALRFVTFRFYESVLVIEVELDENQVEETFDHNPNFFKCKAFGCPETVTTRQMTNFFEYERKKS